MVVTPAAPPPRWALSPDAQPSIPPNSEVLLFIPGMDSRAEEADDITKALFMALPPTPTTPPAWPEIKDIGDDDISDLSESEERLSRSCDHLDDRSSGRTSRLVIRRAAILPR